MITLEDLKSALNYISAAELYYGEIDWDYPFRDPFTNERKVINIREMMMQMMEMMERQEIRETITMIYPQPRKLDLKSRPLKGKEK